MQTKLQKFRKNCRNVEKSCKITEDVVEVQTKLQKFRESCGNAEKVVELQGIM